MSSKQNRELEDNPIWKKANGISQSLRDVMVDIPDEEHGTVMYLRHTTMDITVEAAEAIGSTYPDQVLYELSRLRRDTFGLKGAYLSLHKQGIVDIEPEIMVAINELIALIDDRRKQEIEKEQTIEAERDK